MRKFNPEFYAVISNSRARTRGRMLHIEADNALYSITYRLGDSLPEKVRQELRLQRDELLARLERDDANALQRSEALEQLYKRTDRYLDKGYGSCLLRKPEAASVIEENLKFHDGKLYELNVWNVMPNHVHVSIRLFRGCDLDRTLHAWKSYTAHRINRVLGRRGALWEEAYWDRLIRDEADRRNTERYIYMNSDAAGLKDWRWRGIVNRV